MSRISRIALAALVLFVSGFTSAAAAASSPEEDLERMAAWLAGEFDNGVQVEEDRLALVERPHSRLHSLVLPVEVPALGDHVFFVRQYANDDAAHPYRVSLYSLALDPNGEGIELTPFALPNEEPFRDAHRDPAILAALIPDDLETLPDWKMHFRGEGSRFVAESGFSKGYRSIHYTRTDQPFLRGSESVVRRNEVWINEYRDIEAADPGDDLAATPHRLRRCRFYTGMAIIPVGEAAEGQEKERRVARGLRLHDQGGVTALVDEQGEEMGYELHLASVTNGPTNVPVLELALHRTGEEKPVQSIWASPDSRRIGMNLKHFQAGLTLEESDLDHLVSLMSGHFNSHRQSIEDPEYFDITLHMAPMWTDRTDARWLYVEQAVTEMPDQPYRQRVYRVVEGREPGTFESAVFEFPEPEKCVGEWRETEPLAHLTPDDLTVREGCTVVLRKLGEDTFSGSTILDHCKSTLRGAAYATSKVTISPHQVMSWDQGFDADGNQVWGAEKGAYAFDRIEE